jgi:hypothetical protein
MGRNAKRGQGGVNRGLEHGLQQIDRIHDVSRTRPLTSHRQLDEGKTLFAALSLAFLF